jgi:hypothetical protein
MKNREEFRQKGHDKSFKKPMCRERGKISFPLWRLFSWLGYNVKNQSQTLGILFNWLCYNEEETITKTTYANHIQRCRKGTLCGKFLAAGREGNRNLANSVMSATTATFTVELMFLLQQKGE